MQTLNISTRPLRWGCALLAILALTLTPLAANADVAVDIQCSPSVAVLHSVAAGDCLTVHTNLRFSKVDRTMPVKLNGLPACAVFADSRGYLVAKFDLTDLREILVMPATTLTLTGVTIDGEDFTGSDEIRVME